ncbi:hypothetical protein D3C76_1184690 [compost metagenome]
MQHVGIEQGDDVLGARSLWRGDNCQYTDFHWLAYLVFQIAKCRVLADCAELQVIICRANAQDFLNALTHDVIHIRQPFIKPGNVFGPAHHTQYY